MLRLYLLYIYCSFLASRRMTQIWTTVSERAWAYCTVNVRILALCEWVKFYIIHLSLWWKLFSWLPDSVSQWTIWLRIPFIKMNWYGTDFSFITKFFNLFYSFIFNILCEMNSVECHYLSDDWVGGVDVWLSRKNAITFVRYDRKAGQTITVKSCTTSGRIQNSLIPVCSYWELRFPRRQSMWGETTGLSETSVHILHTLWRHIPKIVNCHLKHFILCYETFILCYETFY
jgi:hypothetical protein